MKTEITQIDQPLGRLAATALRRQRRQARELKNSTSKVLQTAETVLHQ